MTLGGKRGWVRHTILPLLKLLFISPTPYKGIKRSLVGSSPGLTLGQLTRRGTRIHSWNCSIGASYPVSFHNLPEATLHSQKLFPEKNFDIIQTTAVATNKRISLSQPRSFQGAQISLEFFNHITQAKGPI